MNTAAVNTTCKCTNGLNVEMSDWKKNQTVLGSTCTEDRTLEAAKPATTKPDGAKPETTKPEETPNTNHAEIYQKTAAKHPEDTFFFYHLYPSTYCHDLPYNLRETPPGSDI